MKVFLSLFLITFLFVASVYSQVTINVPGDYPTIQEGINAANNGDLVLVADGTYIENINFMGRAITVASHFIQDGDKSHIQNTIIDGSSPSHPDSGSVVTFNSGEDTTSVLKGFTIKNGTGTVGPLGGGAGGIMIFNNSSALICYNIIENNSINFYNAYGGGIDIGLNSGSTTIIKFNIIRNNSAIGSNEAWGGGICANHSGPISIQNNIVENNSVEGSSALGGGISLFMYEVAHINSNKVTNNQALGPSSEGGGISIRYSTSPIFLSNNLIAENVSVQGGGILVENQSEGDSQGMRNFNYKDQTFGENVKVGQYTFLSNKILDEAVIENNTIVNNSAMSYCGGIICFNTLPEIRNSIVWGNQAPAGLQIEGAGLVEYSDVEGGYSGTGNIDIDPEFADSVYCLLTENVSLCIDAGNPDPIYNDVEDPDNPGFALFPAMGTTRNDMGTFGGPHSTWSSIILDTLRVPTDYATIQEAIDAAMNGNVVLVAEGTYYENINFKGKAITVTSHFLVDGDTSHVSNTVIDGSQPSHPDSGSVVYFISGEDTTSVLCGFTITGGTGTYTAQFNDISGGGIYLWPSGAKICNNIIENNSASYNINAYGGGILADLDTSNLIIENNTIRNNAISGATGNTQGGGMAIYDCAYVRIMNNKILDNTVNGSTNSWGGGITINKTDIPSDSTFIIGNYIKGNVVNSGNYGGGGLELYDCVAVVKNNLIVENSAPNGGGMYLDLEASPSNLKRNRGRIFAQDKANNISRDNSSQILANSFFENNTIVNNTATSYGGGLYITGAVPKLMNFIIWGNTALSYPQISGTADVQYSDVEGGYTGIGNMDEDPLFRDAPNNDFHLQSTDCGDNFNSLCIDGGNPAYRDSIMDCDWGLGSQDICDMGAYSVAVIIVGVSDKNNILPDDYELSQNYPNPFNPATTIKYGIKERTNVELKVFDVLGREIETLVYSEQDAGYYEIEFNASSLASGVYFYRIQAGEFVETKKMLLLK